MNVKEDIEKYVVFGKDIPYHGLYIKPVRVSDSINFNQAKRIFLIDKNKIPDIDIIQMTYLQFLFTIVCDSEEYLEDFLTLMAITLGLRYKKENRLIDFKPNAVLVETFPNQDMLVRINGWDIWFYINAKTNEIFLRIGDDKSYIELNAQQFDELRSIILFQNVYEYDDTEMSEDFRRIVDEYYKLKNKDIIEPNLEDKLMVVCTNSAYKIDELYQMPLRLFESLFHYIVNKVEYVVDKLIVNQPNVEVKNFKLDHWVYKTKQNKYADIFTNADDLIKKVTSI